MSAGTIIEEIKHLPPHERAEVARFVRTLEEGRMWTPEELGAAADSMIEEPDSKRSDLLWKKIKAGFYGNEVPDA